MLQAPWALTTRLLRAIGREERQELILRHLLAGFEPPESLYEDLPASRSLTPEEQAVRATKSGKAWRQAVRARERMIARRRGLE